jgi:hypothetical protein
MPRPCPSRRPGWVHLGSPRALSMLRCPAHLALSVAMCKRNERVYFRSFNYVLHLTPCYALWRFQSNFLHAIDPLFYSGIVAIAGWMPLHFAADSHGAMPLALPVPRRLCGTSLSVLSTPVSPLPGLASRSPCYGHSFRWLGSRMHPSAQTDRPDPPPAFRVVLWIPCPERHGPDGPSQAPG